jgi:hypothetical protein
MPRLGGKYFVRISSPLAALAAIVLGWLLAGGPTASKHILPAAISSVQPTGREGMSPTRVENQTNTIAEQASPGIEQAIAEPMVLEGVPEVIDTVTLRVAGSLVRLYGVEWARGGRPEELSQYLQGRRVQCRPRNGAYRCSIGGIDLSRAVLFNGGARAKPDAPPDLHAAERRARSERLGVWERDQSPSRK